MGELMIVVGIFVLCTNKRDIIMLLIGIELVVIGSGIVVASMGSIYWITMIIIGGAEASIGLGIVILMYKGIGRIEYGPATGS